MEAVTLLFGLAGVATLTKKFIDVVVWGRNGNWDPVVKTVLAVVFAVIFTFLLKWSDFSSFVTFEVGEQVFVLKDLAAASIVWIGLSIGATISFAVDVLKSLDNTSSTKTGQLVHPSQPEG